MFETVVYSHHPLCRRQQSRTGGGPASLRSAIFWFYNWCELLCFPDIWESVVLIIAMTESSELPEMELSRKVLKILCHLYEKVESLEAFAKVVVSSQSSTNAVIQSEDSASYLLFLKSTIVCTPLNARTLPQSWLLQQHSRQDEVVLRVIERIRQREGRASTNLLVIGYRLMSDDPDAQISSSRTIEYRIPNSNTSRLQYTPWKILLSRIGDDAMEFLLETRSIFVPVASASTCYVQLSGAPMYELWPFHRYYAQNQRNPTTQKLCTSLLNDSKCMKRRRRNKSKTKLSPSSKEMKTSVVQSCVQGEILPKPCAAVVQQENGEKCTENEYLETEVEDNHDHVDSTETVRKQFSGTKRKAEMNLENEPDKKRIIVTESVSMSDVECVIGLATNSGLSVDPVAETSRKAAQLADSFQQSSTACFRKRKRRRRRKGKLCDGNRKVYRQKSVAFDHRVTIERSPMFFSRDLREKYPPMYVLFNPNMNSPLKLVADILAVRVLYNNKSSSATCCGDVEVAECCSKVQQRLLNIVQLIIRNHQLCRYRYLLQHHSSFTNYTDETAVASGKQTCEKDPSSVTTKHAPKLQVPVYHRGQKSCSARLASTPVFVLQERAQPSRKRSVRVSISHLLEQHCSQRSVFLFVRACCLRVIPTELFGSATNRNKFFRNIRTIIGMGRYEQLSVGCLMTSMRVTHCRWMKEIRSNTERLQLLAKVLCWLMTAFVLPLVKSYFYVTDSATYRNRMFYYRKSLWKKIHQKVKVTYVFSSLF